MIPVLADPYILAAFFIAAAASILLSNLNFLLDVASCSETSTFACFGGNVFQLDCNFNLQVSKRVTKPTPSNIITPKIPDRGTPSKTEDTDHEIPKRIKKIPEIKPVHPNQLIQYFLFNT